MIRPRPARWFELLVARDDTTRALEALAATGAVELEARTAALPPSLTELRPLMQQYSELAQRYRAYWPNEGLRASSFPEPPLAALARCIEALRLWAVQAEPLIRRCQQGQAERTELERWRHVLASLREGLLDADTVAGAPLQSRLFAFSADNPPDLSGPALVHTIAGEAESYALAVGTAAQLQALSQQVLAAKGQAHELPQWLAADRASNLAELERRLASSLAQESADQAALAALVERHQLHQALGDAERLHWVLDNVICPDYSEAAKFGDIWLSVKQGTDAALGMAMGHVILEELHVDRQVPYFPGLHPPVHRYAVARETRIPGWPPRSGPPAARIRFRCRARRSEQSRLEDDRHRRGFTGKVALPNGSVGFRWGEHGKWNIEEKRSGGAATRLRLSLGDVRDDTASVAFPYFGNIAHEHFTHTDHASVLERDVPVKRLKLTDGETLVATVHDLFIANYGVDEGFGGGNVAKTLR